jgi:hypothetical protein
MSGNTGRLFEQLESYGDREGTEAQLDRTVEILRLALDRMSRRERSRFLREVVAHPSNREPNLRRPEHDDP